MSLAGSGVVAIWHNLLPQAKAEFYEWHNREHMPERVGIAGFRAGRRYIAVQGEPEYFNLYEADSAEVTSGQDYLSRLNSPTPWTREVVASFRDVSRSVCRVVYTGGVGQGGFVLTQRFDAPTGQQEALLEILSRSALPRMIGRAGISGAHLCVADLAVSNVATAEKRARAEATVVPANIVLIEGISAQHVSTGSAEMLVELKTAGYLLAPITSTYQLEHSCSKAP